MARVPCKIVGESVRTQCNRWAYEDCIGRETAELDLNKQR
jgi:hypothetical protein